MLSYSSPGFPASQRRYSGPRLSTLWTQEVTYDDTALTPLSVTAGDCLSGGTLTSNLDTLAPGEPFRLTWYSAQDTGDTGLAFTFTWQTAEEAQDVPVSLSFAPSDICNSNQEEVGFTVHRRAEYPFWTGQWATSIMTGPST